MIKKIFCVALLSCCTDALIAQGCSDAGVCTIGDFYAHQIAATKKALPKNEIDLSFTYGTHGQYEKFYQPQLNYRRIQKNGSFFEFRLPLSVAMNTSLNVTESGIGDLTATYNNKFNLKKEQVLKYSVGLRISFSSADRKAANSMYSYPMSLQTGLGTTDLLAAASYDIGKYISVGTGLQVPVIQYNKNVIVIDYLSNPIITANDYHRNPDALLKLTGHYQWKKLKVNGGALAIFHLGNDHYNLSSGKYILKGSSGTTLNWTIEPSYAISKKLMFGILYAEPFKTRTNIPDGLARSRIISPKVTYSFE